MVNCASASGYAFGFSLLDIFLLMLSVGLLNTRRGRIQFGQLKSAKKVRSKERTNKVIHTKIKSATRTTCTRRKRRRNNWKTNQLLTRMQFTIAERENSSFYGKEKTTHNYIIPFKHNRKCIIYSLYIIKLHGSHCFSSSSLLKRRENSSSALECRLFARVFALTILMILSARTAAFFFLGERQRVSTLHPKYCSAEFSHEHQQKQHSAAAFYPPPFLLSKKRG